MDVLSPFIHILCHSDWLFHGESCPRLDVVHPGRAPGIVPCIMSFSRQLPCFLMVWPQYASFPGVLTVPSLLQLCYETTHLFSLLSMKPLTLHSCDGTELNWTCWELVAGFSKSTELDSSVYFSVSKANTPLNDWLVLLYYIAWAWVARSMSFSLLRSCGFLWASFFLHVCLSASSMVLVNWVALTLCRWEGNRGSDNYQMSGWINPLINPPMGSVAYDSDISIPY